MLASLLQSHVSKKRTALKAKLSCTLYGLTRSREIIDLIRKLGLGISYTDVKNLYASWTKQEIEQSQCPSELADGVPGCAIIDNDDFKDDTLTGADTSHRTNVMFVQLASLANKDEPNRPTLSKLLNIFLKQNVEFLTHFETTIYQNSAEIVNILTCFEKTMCVFV